MTLFESALNRDRRDRKGIEDTKREVYKGEPLIAFTTIIQRLKEGHFKSRTSRLLKYAAGDIFLAYGEPYEDADVEGALDSGDEEKVLDAINIVVSENAREGMLAFAQYLSDIGTLAQAMETQAKKSLWPGGHGRVRKQIIELLEEKRREVKDAWPTLDELMDDLNKGNI